ALVQQEIQSLRQQMLNNMQMTDESKTPEDILPDDLFAEEAKKRISLGLLVSEIIHKNEIKLDQDKVAQQLHTISAGYGQPDEVMQYYRNNREAMANVEMMVMEEQVVEYVMSKAKTKAKNFSFDEFVNKQT
ncbi:MAG: trigger factor, partial [Pseudomonadota bacterium]